MSTRHRRAALPGLLALLVLAAGVAPVAGHSPDPFMGRPFDQNQDLRYRWASDGVPPAAIRAAINAAADDANDSRKSEAPDCEHDADGDNVISYGAIAPCGENGLACFRRDAPDWFAVYLRENGHRFDWGTLRWCEATDRPNGCYDAENITLDELGHVLGLDHHENFADDRDYGDAVVQTYSRAKPREFYNAHVFGRCDVATLQRVYDVLNSSTPYSTCLDVPTELSVAANRTSTQPGTAATFTATLRADGPGKLAGNLVTNRAVVLQQRTSSGWSDVATMAPGSSAGTYVASVVPRATAEWRAVFRRSASEGLRSSSSAAVTITVRVACTVAPCPLSVTVAVH
jgi:hypothetical protein